MSWNCEDEIIHGIGLAGFLYDDTICVSFGGGRGNAEGRIQKEVSRIHDALEATHGGV